MVSRLSRQGARRYTQFGTAMALVSHLSSVGHAKAAGPIANTYFTQAFYQEAPDAYWRLNDSVGATFGDDQTLNGYNATVQGPAGSAYLNAGAVAALAYQSRFTVVTAFKTTASGTLTYLISKALSVGPKGWALAIDATGKPRFYGYTAAGVAVFDLTASAAFNDGNWHLAVGVYDPIVEVEACLYVDGLCLAVAPVGLGLVDANAARLLIGAIDNAGTAAGFFVGSLDELSLYPYALRDVQVAALTNARTKLANDRALMQARAGVAGSGATRSNFYASRNIVLVNGVDVAAAVWKKTQRSTDILNEQPDTASLTLFDRTGTLNPVEGQTLILADGAVNNKYFGGTIVRRRRRAVKNPQGLATTVQLFDLTATDWTWLLNRRTVTKQYPTGMLANVAFADVVTTYTSGFTAGNIKAPAPAFTAPLSFKGAKVATVLSQIATAVGWNWYPDPSQDLHFFDVETSQRPKSIVPGNYSYDSLDYTLDLTQVRTRIVVEGSGARTTAPVAIGATSVPVDECAAYSASGGTIVSPGGVLMTYTGRSASSGPGNLTGVPASSAGSVSVALLQGVTLNVWVVVDDAAAQTALGALELDVNGNPTDGIHEQYITVANGTIAQCQQAANTELLAYKQAVVTGTLWSLDKSMRSGKVLTIALPSRNLSIDVTIQQVDRSLLTVNTWQFTVTFGTTWRNLVDVLKRAARAV